MTARNARSLSRRGRSRLPLASMGLAALAVITTALVLHAGGIVEIPFLAGEEPPPPPPDRTGLVAVPRSSAPIGAYSAVERQHVLDPRSGLVSEVWLDPQALPEDVLTDLGEIFGRVLKRDKPAGYVFRESDFYPRGTRPGPAAGVPPGKRAMRLGAADVPGLHGLNQGDRFDIVMTVSVELEEDRSRPSARRPRVDLEGPYAALAAAVPSADDGPRTRVKRKHAEVKLVVENGFVVQPIHERREIETRSGLLRGPTLRTKPVEELIIAVAPEEVAELNMAIAVGAHLQVAIRSGHPEAADIDEGQIPDIQVEVEEENDSSATDEPAPEPVRVVEVIRGGNKHLLAVPPRGGEATAPASTPEPTPEPTPER